ncbi:MAG: thiamine phosphate synthase [Bacteroidales bacterium]|jgi:thiamine-phosphate pyrophosphorylase|nr:thiamine phosphate synthase [Bacteroidales bacterium]
MRRALLFITHQTERYDYLQSVEIALLGGCRKIQLRMKDATPEEVERTGRRALDMCNDFHADLYIDDHVEICQHLQATGVHLGKSDMPPAKARQYLGKDFVIGGTANTFDDICSLLAQGVDYIGLGPFSFTRTKKNLSPVLGQEGYRDIMERCRKANIRLPVIAIGGITRKDIPELMQTGIAGIALSSAILSTDNPVEETKFILQQLNAL